MFALSVLQFTNPNLLMMDMLFLILKVSSWLILTISFLCFCVMCKVEIDGEVLGKGIGLTWDEAKMKVNPFVIYMRILCLL